MCPDNMFVIVYIMSVKFVTKSVNKFVMVCIDVNNMFVIVYIKSVRFVTKSVNRFVMVGIEVNNMCHENDFSFYLLINLWHLIYHSHLVVTPGIHMVVARRH